MDSLKEREKKFIFNTYSRYPIEITKGRGTRLYDREGKEYIDLLSGISVCNLGHCNPEIAEVMCEQSKKLIHVSNLFYTEEQVEFAEKLLLTAPHLKKVFFCNSGAEANEAAIKLSRRYFKKIKKQDRFEIITLKNSFHGRTFATMSATGQDKIKDGFEPLLPGFCTTEPANLEEINSKINKNTAGIMVEVIQGEGGVRPLDMEFIKGIEEICRKHDILFIVDEIQTGMGRTGKMWAFMHYGIEPDIVTCAKALANGLPIGAMMSTEEVAKAFSPGTHATTFGGGPLVCKVAIKVLEIIKRDKLLSYVTEVGNFALSSFNKIKEKYPDLVNEVRGKGLMLGIELSEKIDTKRVVDTLISKGFILNLTQNRILRLLPPLIITQEELALFSNTLENILKETLIFYQNV